MKKVPLFLGVAVVLFCVASLGTTKGGAGIASKGPFSKTSSTMAKGVYSIAIVADLDKKSKLPEEEEKKLTFKSILKEGILRKQTDNKWEVEWSEETELRSQHNEAGRGMELSELVVFNDKLFTFDDRTGIVFEINGKRRVVPRFLLMEGNGDTAKGQKSEWATVKDGKMYVGSFGKEYVNKDGEVTSRNNLWVSVVDTDGVITHEDWTEKYNTIRATTNSKHPGYMMIETIVWSPVHQEWFILPRRVSEEEYNEVLDEKRGSNIIVRCDPKILSCRKFTVGKITPERGFSSARFIPGTSDTLMVALKSEENDKAGTQMTFITVFSIDGKVLLDETLVGPLKYEGLEFI